MACAGAISPVLKQSADCVFIILAGLCLQISPAAFLVDKSHAGQ